MWWSFTVGSGSHVAMAQGGEALAAAQAADVTVPPGCASDGVRVRCTDRQDVAAGHYRVTVPTVEGLRVWVDAQAQALTVSTKASSKKGSTSVFELDLPEGNHAIQLQYPARSLATPLALTWKRMGPIEAASSASSAPAASSPMLLLAGAPAFSVEHYHEDALGSVRAVTDAAGAVVRRHDFLPFGEEWQPPVPPADTRLFSGKERDAETGLDYFGARYYAGSIGRFTTADIPGVDQHLADPQSWNLYVYVRNNPLRYIDPNGMQKGNPQQQPPPKAPEPYHVDVVCDKKCQARLEAQAFARESFQRYVFDKTRPPGDTTPSGIIRLAVRTALGMREWHHQLARSNHRIALQEVVGSICRDPISGAFVLPPWEIRPAPCGSLGCAAGTTWVAGLHGHPLEAGQQQPSREDIMAAASRPGVANFVITAYEGTAQGAVFQYNSNGAWSVWGPVVPFWSYWR